MGKIGLNFIEHALKTNFVIQQLRSQIVLREGGRWLSCDDYTKLCVFEESENNLPKDSKLIRIENN